MKNSFVLPIVIAVAVISVITGIILLSGCAFGGNKKDDKSAVLEFHSFDGGGPKYSVSVADPEIVEYTYSKKYKDSNHAEQCGSGFDEVFTFKGKKSGETEVRVSFTSAVADGEELYIARVGDDLKVTIEKIQEATE